MLGSHIGQYKIVRQIGAGGMGHVFLGEHTLLGRRAAIKTLLPTLSVNREIAERFFNEARATSSISDPGVIQIFDFGYHVDGTAYIVMELLEGEALSARIERLGKLPIADALRIARQGAASLSAAHAHHIVHRDLKPENIFLVHDGEARGGERTKILDFGICKVTGGTDATLTEAGAMIGTPVYMSPEQCRGSDDVDHRSDIYAFGCLMFHMLAGRPPFMGNSSGELIVAHLREQPPLASSFAPEIPPELDALLGRCLAKTADQRFQSMTELQAAIEELAAKLPATEAVPAAQPALLLGQGFRSVYAGNLASPAPTGSPAPIRTGAAANEDYASRIKFGTPSPGRDDDELEPRPKRSGLRALLTISLVVGLIGGLAATSVLLGSDDAAAEAKPKLASTRQPVTDPGSAAALPAPASATEPPASAPSATESAPVSAAPTRQETPSEDTASRAPSPPAAAPATSEQLAHGSQPDAGHPATLTVKKPAAKARPHPPARKPKTVAGSPVEDLYDTR
ncbi:MAG: serine/threonine protein kinase [Myxococcales bacterium]|nr:serine/threonine protein kinase [Myxococcales bacterium]